MTRSIRMIREEYRDKTEQDKAIERLRIYMNWSPKADTMKVYEHYVDEKDYVAEQHDRLLENMKKDQEEYLNQLKSRKKGYTTFGRTSKQRRSNARKTT